MSGKQDLFLNTTEEIDGGDLEEADEEGKGYEGDGVDGLEVVKGANGRGGFVAVAGGFGLGGLKIEGGGGAGGVCYLLAVGGGSEARGIAIIVGLDCDGGGFSDSVVEGVGYHLAESVVDGFRSMKSVSMERKSSGVLRSGDFPIMISVRHLR